MMMNTNRVLQTMAAATLGIAMMAGAQAPAPAPAPAPAAAPAAPTWSVGPMDISGFIDGYYTFNANNPDSQMNGLYNFNIYAQKFSLNAAKLTLNHDADPVGARIDVLYGDANTVMGTDYIEQAYLELKPAKAKGFELDLGKFVTSAGAEVIESKDNWNYSRSLLFVNAIPYYHIGARLSGPVSKTDTVGLQIVDGWNGGNGNKAVTIGLVNALTKTKYTWNLNVYTGPGNTGTTKGFNNLIDTTLLLTPNAKFNAYINYDYDQLRTATSEGTAGLVHKQGIAVAAHEQITAKSALSERGEYLYDPQLTTGASKLKEFTLTYEYKWIEGLLARVEYRYDNTDKNIFDKNAAVASVNNQSTITLGMVAFFGPKR